MVRQIKNYIKKLQEGGVPIVILKDNVTGKPSITYTFFVTSGVIVVLGLIGKSVKLLDGVDMVNALHFFYGCGALYLGRKITNKDNATKVDKE